MTLTSPFYAYVINKSLQVSTGKKVYFPEPVLVFGSFVNNTGVNFVYEVEGEIKTTEGQFTLYDRPYGEKQEKVLIKLENSETYKVMTIKDAVKKKYLLEDQIEEIEEEENEEADESIASTDKGQKSKSTVSKDRKRK